jgi:hypothetical protein
MCRILSPFITKVTKQSSNNKSILIVTSDGSLVIVFVGEWESLIAQVKRTLA